MLEAYVWLTWDAAFDSRTQTREGPLHRRQGVPMRRTLACLSVLVALLVGALSSEASAATVSLEDRTLLVRSAAGDGNALEVRLAPRDVPAAVLVVEEGTLSCRSQPVRAVSRTSFGPANRFAGCVVRCPLTGRCHGSWPTSAVARTGLMPTIGCGASSTVGRTAILFRPMVACTAVLATTAFLAVWPRRAWRRRRC